MFSCSRRDASYIKTMTKAGSGDGPDFRLLSIMCKNKDTPGGVDMRIPQTYDDKIAKGYKVICGKRVGTKQ